MSVQTPRGKLYTLEELAKEWAASDPATNERACLADMLEGFWNGEFEHDGTSDVVTAGRGWTNGVQSRSDYSSFKCQPITRADALQWFITVTEAPKCGIGQDFWRHPDRDLIVSMLLDRDAQDEGMRDSIRERLGREPPTFEAMQTEAFRKLSAARWDAYSAEAQDFLRDLATDRAGFVRWLERRGWAVPAFVTGLADVMPLNVHSRPSMEASADSKGEPNRKPISTPVPPEADVMPIDAKGKLSCKGGRPENEKENARWAMIELWPDGAHVGMDRKTMLNAINKRLLVAGKKGISISTLDRVRREGGA